MCHLPFLKFKCNFQLPFQSQFDLHHIYSFTYLILLHTYTFLKNIFGISALFTRKSVIYALVRENSKPKTRMEY